MKARPILLFLILAGYAFLYTATSKQEICEGDCDQVRNVRIWLIQTKPYFVDVRRCTNIQGSDTLCVYVRDTTGVNWNNFADTVCLTASMYGLNNQKVIVLKQGTIPFDTLAKKSCP